MDSVETTRGGLVEWNNLQALYDELGTFQKIAQAFGCSLHKVQNEMRKHGIPPKQRGRPKGYKRDEKWHAAHKAAMARPEVKQKYRDNLLKRLPFMKGSSANSPLERLLHTALQKAGISFSTQRRKLNRYVVDIEISQAPIIIEADGALHCLHRERDARRDSELQAIGYRVFRFQGKEINRDPNGCITQVIDACRLVPDAEPQYDIRNGMIGEDNPAWKGGQSRMTCAHCGTVFSQYASHRKYKRTFCKAEHYYAWLRNNPEYLPSRWGRKNVT